MTLEISHFQSDRVPNSASLETSYYGVEGFTTRKERHFQTIKMLKSCL
jgi:hypothetical protein